MTAATHADAIGLSQHEATLRLQQHGPNRPPRARKQGLPRHVLAQLTDPMILVLLGACVLTSLTGDHHDTAVIGLVVVLNTAVGVAQQRKADQAVEALEQLAAPTVTVIRDGVPRTIPAAELVPGDAVRLTAGDVVPADGDLLAGPGLEVDESLLTGESVPVPKRPGADSLGAGTRVTRGSGLVVVTATGADSGLGRIAADLVAGTATRTPLQRRLARLSRDLAVAVAVICLVVMAVGLARGERVELMLVTAVSLAVAAVPESLPAVVTLALALGSRRMASRHALVRRLSAVETLGSVTVLATDKTGTLTEGTMAVADLWVPDDDDEGAARRWLLSLAVLCSDAEALVTHTSDPLEVALVDAARAAGVDLPALAEGYPRTGEVPFDAASRRMTTMHRTASGERLTVSKGAPEALLEQTGKGTGEGPAWAATQAAAGRRVLAVVAGRDAELQLIGLVALADPLRAAAPAALAACRRAGIRPVLITGDHPATAASIARQVGLWDDGEPYVLDDAQPLPVAQVYARARPDHKLAIIDLLQSRGEVVAMTGDGVNDAPALQRADIGVVLGHRGAEVAKQAADVILLDDDLGTLVHAVEEGRRIYGNIRSFLLYAISGGLAEILVMLFGPFVGMTVPLLPAQILWINLMTHGLPGVAMGAEPGDPDALDQPPRRPEESVLGDGLWQRIAVVGTVLAVAALALGSWLHNSGGHWQTAMFLTLALLQLGVALGLRAPHRGLTPLVFAVLGSLVLDVAAVYLPVAHTFLSTRSLTVAELAASAAVGGVLGFATSRLLRRHGPGRGRTRQDARPMASTPL